MFKKLSNSLLISSVLLFNNILFERAIATQIATNTGQLLPAPQIQGQPGVNQQNQDNNSAAVVGQSVNINNIKPTDTVAVVTGNGNAEPNVYKTDKKIFPANFTGWVYIMSGSDYLEYIKEDDYSNSQQQYKNTNTSQLPVTQNTTNINPTLQRVSNVKRKSRILPQPVSQQPIQQTVPQQMQVQNSTPLPQIINTPAPVNTQQYNQTVVQDNGKIEQGKPDNEAPEVLIHDGAVYTLANSVEVTKPSNNANTQNNPPIPVNNNQTVINTQPTESDNNQNINTTGQNTQNMGDNFQNSTPIVNNFENQGQNNFTSDNIQSNIQQQPIQTENQSYINPQQN